MFANRQSSKRLEAICNSVKVILRFAGRGIPNSIVSCWYWHGLRTLVSLLFSTKTMSLEEGLE